VETFAIASTRAGTRITAASGCARGAVRRRQVAAPEPGSLPGGRAAPGGGIAYQNLAQRRDAAAARAAVRRYIAEGIEYLEAREIQSPLQHLRGLQAIHGLVVLPNDQYVATSWDESRPTANPAAARDRPTIPGLPPAASSASCHSPRSTSRTTPTSSSTRAFSSSTEDGRRGMSRGTNHSAQEDIRDTSREQKAQVGR
jgi:hypothetical protein